jgi:hypothetical protein
MEPLLSGVMGPDVAVAAYLTGVVKGGAGRPPPVFDFMVLTREQLYIFTVSAGNRVSGAVCPLKELRNISYDEDGVQMLVTFGYGGLSSLTLGDTLENSARLMEFAKMVQSLAWSA